MRTFLLTEFSADKTYRQKKAPEQAEAFLFQLAEEVGFEPTKGVNPCQFSRLVLSTAQPPFQVLSSLRSAYIT